MPKLPSPYRIPEAHLLPDDELRAEAATRDFQRTVNRQKYLAWYTLVRKVKPDARYEIKSYGFQTETLSGQETLGRIRPVVDTRCRTFVNSVTRVSDGHTTPVEALWQTVTEPDGSVRVWNHDHDAFDHSSMTMTIPEIELVITETFGANLIDHMVTVVVDRRLGEQAPTPDFDDVLQLTRRAIINGLAMTTAAGHTPDQAIPMAGDRAFATSRLSAAGINLDNHPEFRSYQKFFELRMLPPAHAEMVDTIIALLAAR